jgi:hypothetical protein
MCSCGKPTDSPGARPDGARHVLEKPFHFLLDIADYEAGPVQKQSDMFSTWGNFVLTRRQGTPNRSVSRDEILSAAKRAGWTRVAELPLVDHPDHTEYRIAGEKEDLAISRTEALPGQNPPTRYSCLIWIAKDGGMVLVAYRVDAE